jgi:hypothetical protein
MSNHIWHAFYFEGPANLAPPVRTELIEAETEDAAAEVAKDHLGRCKRVELAPPRWEPSSVRVILADEEAAARGSMH